ncbi:MAG: imm11 family protein [Synechococcus sp.]
MAAAGTASDTAAIDKAAVSLPCDPNQQPTTNFTRLKSVPYLLELGEQAFYEDFDYEPKWVSKDLSKLTLETFPLTAEMSRNAPKILRLHLLDPNLTTLPRCFKSPGSACVDAEFKDLIQSLEPDLHTFIPVEVLDQNNKSYGTCFMHYVHHFADAIDCERTEFTKSFGLAAAEESGFRFRRIDNKRIIAIDPEKAKHRYFWRDSSENGHRTSENFYCSDRVANFIREKTSAVVASKNQLFQ